jgi:ribonuclease HI
VTDRILIYCDGGSRGNPGPAAVGAVVLDADTEAVLTTVSERIGEATNNVAEYQALIRGLEEAAPFEAAAVHVRADSQLLVRQLEGAYKVKQPHLKPLWVRARELLDAYEDVRLEHVRRELNTDADALVNAALDVP